MIDSQSNGRWFVIWRGQGNWWSQRLAFLKEPASSPTLEIPPELLEKYPSLSESSGVGGGQGTLREEDVAAMTAWIAELSVRVPSEAQDYWLVFDEELFWFMEPPDRDGISCSPGEGIRHPLGVEIGSGRVPR